MKDGSPFTRIVLDTITDNPRPLGVSFVMMGGDLFMLSVQILETVPLLERS
ncbi:hypothetical protein LINPERHAP2_LOCUS7456 [Linum perenne]